MDCFLIRIDDAGFFSPRFSKQWKFEA